ncbi:MAG: transposase [Gammaproteobacteria bacterium]|nr:transposase [Gammaproteobacteria bacterium]
MPRPLRIEYSGAWYHVMNRGINHMPIFTENKHRDMFLHLLKEISTLFQIEIHSYCLMDNHYHILLRTPIANLGKAMRHLNGVYTQRYNRITKRDGSLFRGRYKAILIEAERYLIHVSRYIHLNPVAAKLVQQAHDFKWSSYRFYLANTFQEWLHTSHILNFFENTKRYSEFINEGVDDELNRFYNQPQLPTILGGKKFSEEKIKNLSENYKVATYTDISRVKKRVDIQIIHEITARYFQVEPSFITTPSKKSNQPRMLAIYLARNFSLLTHQKIAEYFTGITRASISTTLKRCAFLINTNTDMKRHCENLIAII